MILYTSNIEGEVAELIRKVSNVADTDAMLRSMAATTVPLMRLRVHVDGQAADGTQIGEYKDSYLKVRQGKRYNRTADRRVVASLTRQMEMDLSVIATERGYGVGYKNSYNFDKSQWVEERFKKDIFSLSDTEGKAVIDVALTHVNDAVD